MVAIPPELLSPTIAAIDVAREGTERRAFDLVIRGSSLGRPCERDLWYRFRWAREPERFSGRMLRLFETGHRDEERMISDLRRTGISVYAIESTTGEQIEVVALDGHLKGHLDGIVEGLKEAPIARHILECKTHNEKNFKQLKKDGVSVAKPEHLAQMQIYMHLQGVDRAFYLAKNKNDEELYAERIHYNAAHALALMAKAERILDAASPPARVSDDADWFVCRFCPSKGVCHAGDFALRNCRTCLHSTPVRGGDARWTCELHGRDLTLEDQEAGCGQHLFIPDLVPGEQVDVAPDGSAVIYLMRDGAEWIDGRPQEANASGGVL